MKAMMNKTLFAAVLALFAIGAQAASEKLKPFVLADVITGDMATVKQQVEKKLVDAGFEVAGSYSPYAKATVIAFTNDEMKQNAAKSKFGGYGAAQRVSITQAGADVQVAYTNPRYMANMYRMEGDLAGVTKQLETVLGKRSVFGSKKGLRIKKLRKYHYMFGMEYFDDYKMHKLATHADHKAALKIVESNLKKKLGGVSKVYRIDIPGKDEVVFGVGMKGAGDENKYMDDSYIMGIIDFKDVKATAHLPHEILVSGNEVYHLYARFRIAINFPDLSMMGDNSFMRIVESPEALKKALAAVAGGKIKVDYWDD